QHSHYSQADGARGGDPPAPRTTPAKLEAKPRELQAADALLRRDGVEGGDHLARDEAGLVGDLVNDAEPPLNPVWRVHDGRHDRHLAADVEEPVAVRWVVAGEAPDAAQAGGAARPLLAEPADQLDVERVIAMPVLLAGVDHQLLPDAETGLVLLGEVAGLGEELAVAFADADALERDDRVGQQLVEER